MKILELDRKELKIKIVCLLTLPERTSSMTAVSLASTARSVTPTSPASLTRGASATASSSTSATRTPSSRARLATWCDAGIRNSGLKCCWRTTHTGGHSLTRSATLVVGALN